MVISHKYRCIVLHIPKTGGSSIRHFLLQIPGFEAPPGNYDHGTREEYIADHPECEDYTTIAYPRYPWGRIESSFKNHFKGLPAEEWPRFAHFIESLGPLLLQADLSIMLFCPQTHWLTPRVHWRHYYETSLESRVRLDLAALGVPHGHIPEAMLWDNSGVRHECAWTDEAQDAFRRLYATDLARLSPSAPDAHYCPISGNDYF